MRIAELRKKLSLEKVLLLFLVAVAIVFLVLIVNKLNKKEDPQQPQVLRNTSDLIDVKEIATLSVSECSYNGIAQSRNSGGKVEFDVLYHSTVKVSVDVDKIKHTVDEEQKKVTFEFPDFTIEEPIIDISSIEVISNNNGSAMEDIIAFCRKDAAEETKKSQQLLTVARENLKTVFDAWYTPVLEGYTLEYKFGTAEGGEET